MVKDKLTDLWGSSLLQNVSNVTLSEISSVQGNAARVPVQDVIEKPKRKKRKKAAEEEERVI